MNGILVEMAQSHLKQLLRGVIEPLLLFIIGELPMHGYRIAKELERRSSGYFRLGGSTIYSTLRRLEKRGLVLSFWQQITQKQKRRCYKLTERGREILAGKVDEWQKFYSATNKIIQH